MSVIIPDAIWKKELVDRLKVDVDPLLRVNWKILDARSGSSPNLHSFNTFVIHGIQAGWATQDSSAKQIKNVWDMQAAGSKNQWQRDVTHGVPPIEQVGGYVAFTQFVIGGDGEILMATAEPYRYGKHAEPALPVFRQRINSAYANFHTVGVELVHMATVKKKFTVAEALDERETYGKVLVPVLQSLHDLVQSLTRLYGKFNFARHFDVTGKFCPAYFVPFRRTNLIDRTGFPGCYAIGGDEEAWQLNRKNFRWIALQDYLRQSSRDKIPQLLL
jgi:hypothetical protein